MVSTNIRILSCVPDLATFGMWLRSACLPSKVHPRPQDHCWFVQITHKDQWMFNEQQSAAMQGNSVGYGLSSQATATCPITKPQLALENIIPRAEKTWFGTNRMDQHGNISNHLRFVIGRLHNTARLRWRSGSILVLQNNRRAPQYSQNFALSLANV